jgi:Domain of unknown function (DUF4398)
MLLLSKDLRGKHMKTIQLTRSRIALVTLIIAGGLTAACASDPAPNDQLASSEVAIARAMRAGAAELAPTELGLARDKSQLARRWIAASDNRPARWLAEQAQVDAELAEMKAMSARAMTAAARARQEFRLLTASARSD